MVVYKFMIKVSLIRKNIDVGLHAVFSALIEAKPNTDSVSSVWRYLSLTSSTQGECLLTGLTIFFHPNVNNYSYIIAKAII